METIFKITRNATGESVYLRNQVSTVHVGRPEAGTGAGGAGAGGAAARYTFRNAPHFLSFLPTHKTARDAEDETEAALDHYFTHPNTAPFLAYRLIQRLTASSPSPRYVKAGAEAFASGDSEGDPVVSVGQHVTERA